MRKQLSVTCHFPYVCVLPGMRPCWVLDWHECYFVYPVRKCGSLLSNRLLSHLPWATTVELRKESHGVSEYVCALLDLDTSWSLTHSSDVCSRSQKPIVDQVPRTCRLFCLPPPPSEVSSQVNLSSSFKGTKSVSSSLFIIRISSSFFNVPTSRRWLGKGQPLGTGWAPAYCCLAGYLTCFYRRQGSCGQTFK